MKKIIITICFLTAIQVSGWSQTSSPEYKKDSILQVILTQVGASTTQIAQFKQAKKNYAQQIKQIRLSTAITDAQKLQQVKQLTEAKNAQYKQILGPEKYHEYNFIRAQMPEE